MSIWKVVAILVVGYFIGAYFGSFGTNAVSKLKAAV